MFERPLVAARYLSLSSPPWKWRLHTGRCPGCAGGLFLALGATPFHIRCIKCRSTAVNLSIIPVISKHFQGTDSTGKSAYEMSTYGATHDYLVSHFTDVQFSEYFSGQPLGHVVNGVRNEDATQLTFTDQSFDLVTSNQVFEHVVDDLSAYKECHRVLRPGGALIFTVPLYDSSETKQLARISSQGQIEWLGTPEYHDSRTTGPGTVPVFWLHSRNDIAQRVGSAGFRSVSIVPTKLYDGMRVAQPVLYAVK